MKKLFIIVAVATLGLFSCQQEQDPVNDVVNNETVTFKASIESFATRADLGTGNSLLWSSGDKIGIYFPTWGEDDNQTFNLIEGAGTTSGTFKRENEKTFYPRDANAAFFPRVNTINNDGGTSYNYVDKSGNVLFYLPEGYYKYTSGKMLTPLVASLSGSIISFKHAGAAVKVTINNLPARAKSIGMTVDGQQVRGNYKINYANAGVGVLALNETSDALKNTVWLNYDPITTERSFTFIFPVPELTKPDLSFQIYDNEDVLVWSANPKAQSNDVGRAQVLNMPALTIDIYKDLNTDSDWGVCGDCTSWADGSDITMKTDANNKVHIAKNVEFGTSTKFKIRKGGSWGTSENNYGGTFNSLGTLFSAIGGGEDITLPSAGKYDIIFYSSDKKFYCIKRD